MISIDIGDTVFHRLSRKTFVFDSDILGGLTWPGVRLLMSQCLLVDKKETPKSLPAKCYVYVHIKWTPLNTAIIHGRTMQHVRR